MITKKNYKKGDIIYMEGEVCQSLSIVNTGKAKVYKYTKEGKEQILYILGEGEFFGEMSLMSHEKLNFNVAAVEDTNLCSLDRNSFNQVLSTHPEISVKILQVMGEKLKSLEFLAQNLGSKDAESKIVYLLVKLAREWGKETKEGIAVSMPLTREDMANYIGVTRETISRKLTKLQGEGLIDLEGNRKIIIKDMEGLELY